MFHSVVNLVLVCSEIYSPVFNRPVHQTKLSTCQHSQEAQMLSQLEVSHFAKNKK